MRRTIASSEVHTVAFWGKKEDEEGDSVQLITKSGSEIPGPAVLAAGAKAPVSQSGGSLTDRFGKLRSALSVGSVIQGRLSFDTPVRIDGKLSGEIFSSRALIVGPSAIVDAKVDAATLVVYGKVQGQIKVWERVELLCGASLEGQVETPLLVVEEGAKLNASCKMVNAAEMNNPLVKPVITPNIAHPGTVHGDRLGSY